MILSNEQTSPRVDPSVRTWVRELDSAKGREKKWRKRAKEAVDIYEAEKSDEIQYNILYSNTETMAPALYNEVPRPVVKRRFKDADPTALAAAKATERTLTYLVDTNELEYPPFDDLMKTAVLEALVPGRGLTRWKYDAKVVEGEDGQPSTIAYETICGQEVRWDFFLHGYAKTWNRVPWVAFIHFMNRDELTDNYGEEIAQRVPLTYRDVPQADDEAKGVQNQDKEHEPTLACVYEIWDKQTRKVYHLAEGFSEGMLKIDEDPYSLTGFFPICRPLMLFQKISTLVPTTLFEQYRKQANELNLITNRIEKLTKAMRIRGFYDPRVPKIESLLQAAENDMIPAEGLAAIGELKNFDQIIWLMPIDRLIVVLQQLYLNREQIKTVIFEIMGIADILRGSSKASETFGAQDLKAKWGSLRLKRMQKEVVRYCRDSLRIMSELAMTKLQPKTIAGMTGLPFVTQEQSAQAKMLTQMAQQAQQQVDPLVQQAAQAPVWEEVLGLLQDDMQRQYRVDIETNSTIDPEAAEDQKNIAELMGALSQFLNGMGPLIAEGVMPFQAAQTIMLAVSRRFRFGDEIEEQLRQMQQPQKQDDGKKEAEAAKMQQEFKLQQDRLAMEKQEAIVHARMESQKQQQDFQLKMQQLSAQMEFERQKYAEQMAFEREKFAQQMLLEREKMHAQRDVELQKTKITSQAQERTAREANAVQARQVESENVRQQASQSQDLIKAMQNVVSQTEKAENGQALKVMVQGLTQILQTLTAPKQISLQNGPDGKPVGATVRVNGNG